jgi:NADPH-dependent glutamate synthase beta subunit-like oxidoreductase/NAD(P)H-flavin reductase
MTQPTLSLAHNLQFADLHSREGLLRLDEAFLSELATADAELHAQYSAARANPDALSAKEESALMMAIAPHLEQCITTLFGIQPQVDALITAQKELDPLYACKRLFVQRRAAKSHPAATAAGFDGYALLAEVEAILGEPFNELAFAKAAMEAIEATDAPAHLDTLLKFAAWAAATQHFGRESILFTSPKKLDFENLVHTHDAPRPCEDGETLATHSLHDEAMRRTREDFSLTDARGTLAKALDEINYCIYCHHQGRDSCSKGFKETPAKPSLDAQASRPASHEPSKTQPMETQEGVSGATKKFKDNPLSIPLNGCPLEEHISEMHELKAKAVPLGALAAITVANPMCAGTGHRICNDCMKACVYQKQEPVNIPLAETRILDDVLALPWGFEIYSLLTRWNPLNLRRPLPQAESGKRVLVVGMGPAGYTLAHHLMNDGHSITAIEALKVEPLPEHLLTQPIYSVDKIREPLANRVGSGFGGVAEYGITVRWDKNFLTMLRLLLERRAAFSLHGGVRFGSTLTPDQAWEMGFDHIALCMGAGKPTMIPMENGLARGVRTASDFLMNLQLSGAGRMDSIANLQVRLPIAVIGGGLTAIDTTTEALAYYPLQVEKFLTRYEALVAQHGDAAVEARWSAEDREVAEEFIAHARAICAEKAHAQQEGRAAEIHTLLERWGGATLVYRKRLMDAPSYRLNHEEVEKALEEGIFFAELWEPAGVEMDEHGAARALKLKQAGGSAVKTIPARTILMAAGTSPNTVLAREYPESVMMDGYYFRALDEDGNPARPDRNAKPDTPRVLMQLREDGRAISFFGDLHPSYAGNVVKAMGSAKQGYPVISRMLSKLRDSQVMPGGISGVTVNDAFRASVHAVHRLTPTIIEVVLHAPLAAANFQPGQFYRLQNFEAYARSIIMNRGQETAEPSAREAATHLSFRRSEGGELKTTLAMEPLAMTGAWVDKDAGLLSVIALEMGGSSDLCAQLQPGEPVSLMGPTGTPTHIPENTTMLLVGGGLGNAVLFSIGQAARAKGTKVVYFAGYKALQDRYKVEQIELAADTIIWCCDEAPGFAPTRPQDKTFIGNIVEAMRAYGAGDLGECSIPLADATHAVVIGSDRMMAAVQAARHGVLKPYLDANHKAVGSINSPMQCMMKEICGACLQRHVNPQTGEVKYVYSCFDQDQDLDMVDFHFLNARLRQNSVSEKLTALWIDTLLAQEELRPQRVA